MGQASGTRQVDQSSDSGPSPASTKATARSLAACTCSCSPSGGRHDGLLVSVSATDLEEFGNEIGGETDQLYDAAGWGLKPMRYWLPTSEVNRRLAVLGRLYEMIGIQGNGASTSIKFDEPAPAAG